MKIYHYLSGFHYLNTYIYVYVCYLLQGQGKQFYRVEKTVQPSSELFLPIPNLPHLCGEFSTKNQLLPMENETTQLIDSLIFGDRLIYFGII